MSDNTTSFAIYVASLSDYNAGILHGRWINLDECEDIDDLKKRVGHMLSLSPTAIIEGRPAEEYAIHDYEGFGDNEISEYSSLSEVWENYEELKQADENGDLEPFQVYRNHINKGDYHEFLEYYRGQFESEEEFALSYLEDSGMLSELPDWARLYFDYEAYTRDLFMEDFTFIDGCVFARF